jgi:hypothetical protein
MVVGFTTTCAITTKVANLNPARASVNSIQRYVISNDLTIGTQTIKENLDYLILRFLLYEGNKNLYLFL